MKDTGFRDTLALIGDAFPGKISLTPVEASRITGMSPRQMQSAAKRTRNAFPLVYINGKKSVVPVVPLAKWLTTL